MHRSINKWALVLGCLGLTFFFHTSMHAQVIGIPRHDQLQAIIQRLMMQVEDSVVMHSSHSYYTRADVIHMITHLKKDAILSTRDRDDIQYLLDECLENEVITVRDYATENQKVFVDSTQTFYTIGGRGEQYRVLRAREEQRGIWGVFYKTPANFLKVDKPAFYARVNPVFDFSYGKSTAGETIFTNLRGAEMRGGIADRVFFYANIHETQQAFPQYVNDWVSKYDAVPGAGFRKNYSPAFLKDVQGYDYLNAQGVVGVRLIPQITAQFGHGKNFIGDGYRSLFLSDVGANYLYLKLNTKVWIFDYQNIFAELNATSQRKRDQLIDKKYFANHHLSLRLAKWLQVGVFESVVFGRNNHFELQYLNPIIFYRTVEQMVGSEDNAMIGGDLKITLGKNVRFYGQLMLDELKIKNLIKQNGWWGNKYGIQVGGDYYNAFGVDHLDLKAEYNMVRPYTYTHRDSSASYSHYNQPLAHPLGANFQEMLFRARYVITPSWTVEPYLVWMEIGEDSAGINMGSNILQPYITHTGEFGVELGQGDKLSIWMGGIDMSYRLYHMLYADVQVAYRRSKKLSLEQAMTPIIWSVGLRMNIGRKNMIF